MATFTTGPNGQLIATSVPVITTGAKQMITGSPLDAAANKTMTEQQNQAAAVKALGAGQKGSSRRRRRRGGGIPEAGTIPGVSFAGNSKAAIDNLNQLRADKSYDSLMSAPPRVGGRTKKRSRKVKKNGRSHKRTHRRIIHKRRRNIRRTSRVL